MEELNDNVHSGLQHRSMEQCLAYDTVMDSVNGQSEILFLQGSGGTGKTIVENLLLARVRSNGQIALAVASSGIAALPHKGRRTAHLRFKIPPEVTEDTTWSISKQGDLAELSRRTSLII
jgi:ATP-dependent DNA helicase PIF1